MTQKMYMQYLGCLALLCECSVALQDTVECEADELRDCINRALSDAQVAGVPIAYRRILNRFEIEITEEGGTP